MQAKKMLIAGAATVALTGIGFGTATAATKHASTAKATPTTMKPGMSTSGSGAGRATPTTSTTPTTVKPAATTAAKPVRANPTFAG
jgi:uncharacterized protein YggE